MTAGEASAAAGAQLTNLTSAMAQQLPGFRYYGEQASSGSAGVIVYAQVFADSTQANQVNAAEFSAALQAQIGTGDQRERGHRHQGQGLAKTAAGRLK